MLVIFLAVVFCFRYYRAPVDSHDTARVSFTVNQGDGVQKIADRLKARGLIRSPMMFIYVAFTGPDGNNFYPGTYQLSRAMPPEEIIEIISTKPPAIPIVKVLFKEGWTIGQYADAAAKHPFCGREEFLKIARNPMENDIDTHGHEIHNLEGFLFPATYEFRENVDCEFVVQTLVDQFFKVFTEDALKRAKELYRDLAKGHAKNLQQKIDRDLSKAVTMASLIEKESRVQDERKIVGGVFYKRLEKSNQWKLECDATFKYLDGEWVPDLKKSDYRARSNEYNTYEIHGLPPGPIGNPGKESIEAALDPEMDTPFWYFVAKNDGSYEHFFSSSYGQHQRAIRCSNHNQYNAVKNCVP